MWVKEIAKWIGIKLTKESFAKGLGKVIPILGGIISGSITFLAFRPSAKRLQHRLQEEMFMINENYSEGCNDIDADQYSSYEEVPNEPIKEEEKEA